jgi:hypothetical protein
MIAEDKIKKAKINQLMQKLPLTLPLTLFCCKISINHKVNKCYISDIKLFIKHYSLLVYP